MWARDSPTIRNRPQFSQKKIKMWSWGSYRSSQSRYSVLVEKFKSSFPLWGAVSQNVYIDTTPLMPNVLTFTPSKGSWSPSTLSLSRDKLGSSSVFFRIWGQPRIKKPKVVWCGNIWIQLTQSPYRGEGAKWFLSSLGMIRCGKSSCE